MSSTAGPSQDVAVSKKRKRVDSSTADRNGPLNGDDEGPACTSCRRRKTRCSREQPCVQCARLDLDCYYNDTQERPGVKTGAIESLNQRLSTLEQMFLGQGVLFEPILKGFLGTASPNPPTGSPRSRARAIKEHYLAMAESGTGRNEAGVGGSSKPSQNSEVDHSNAQDGSLLPPLHALSDIVSMYFQNLHPWIPIIHESTFREAFADETERLKLQTILQAMTSVCIRYDITLGLSQAEKLRWSLECRSAVILAGMDCFSITNLQAMVIISFDIIGSGRGPSSWSIVGSMTRTVEHLQLGTETDDVSTDQHMSGYMIARMNFLQRSKTWKEVEERRRVFWNIFLMDRFCSVATGWRNSLTSEDVKRRLPCEGALWQKGNQVSTPFFGVIDHPVRPQENLTPTSDTRTAEGDGVEHIGGFAFCIEATENLNLVTKFFLQSPVKFNDVHHVQIWLLRFKELDLRLVRWRAFLPPRWRNACALNADGIMDPNLTLAHILHNTAVIQLHQAIAYPVLQWHQNHVKLPSDHSAETCITAAHEISIITTQFLTQTTIIINPQFSFCLFVAGRVLFAHAQRYAMPLDSALDTIIGSLNDIAQRWQGYVVENHTAPQSLASQFARRLEKNKKDMTVGEGMANRRATENLDIRQAVYSNHTDTSREVDETETCTHEAVDIYSQPAVTRTTTMQRKDFSPGSVTLAFPPMPAGLDFAYSAHPNNALPLGNPQNLSTPVTNVQHSKVSFEHNMAPLESFEDPNNMWDVDFGTWLFDETSRISTFR